MTQGEGQRKMTGQRGRIVALVFALIVLLSGCLVNQRDLWASDKLAGSSPTTRSLSMSDISYGPDPLQKLDVYLPSSTARGIVIWFHAGGWCCGDKSEIDPLILTTIDKGYALVSVNYRLVPGVTAEQQVADVDRSIRFIKTARNSWGAGVGKIAVAGGSAGGTLALLAAAVPGHFAGPDLGALSTVDPRIDAVISFVGPSDLRPYIDGTIGGWGPSLAEGFLGCSNRGSQWPTTTTTSTSTTTTSTTTTSAPTTSSTTTTSSSSTSSTSVVPSQSFASLAAQEPSIQREDVYSLSTAMPTCDSARVLRFSPVFWAALTVLLGGHHLPPAYFAYGDQDWLVPPSSQGVVLHDWWAAGGNWLATYYDNPPSGGHNLSFDANVSAFSLWLKAFVSP